MHYSRTGKERSDGEGAEFVGGPGEIRAAAAVGDSSVCVNTLPPSPRTSVHSLPFARSGAPPGDHFLCELGLPADYSPLGRIAVYQCL